MDNKWGQRGEGWVVMQAILLILFIAIPGKADWLSRGWLYGAGWGAVSLAALLFCWSALNLGRLFTPLPRPRPDGKLIIQGAYRFVRHPMYLGVLLFCLGFSLVTASWARLGLTFFLFFFFDRKARKEECWLLEQYAEYKHYQANVKKLIPWVY